MEDSAAIQLTTSLNASDQVGRSTCSSCGGAHSATTMSQAQATVVGTITAAFPSLSVEKEFAQRLGQKDFKGFTDRQTMHAILTKAEHRYLARKICFMLTPYGGGSSPAYILLPEEPSDLTLLLDTLRRSPNTSEFDVVKGRIVGLAPPALCNAQQLPVLAFSQLYSFSAQTLIESIPQLEKADAKAFVTAADDAFHRIMRLASNATGPSRALAYAALSYAGLYRLVAEKAGENSSLSQVAVNQPQSNPDLAEVRLKFVRRDTGFSETYCFVVNVGGPFEYLEEPLHPCL